MHLMILLSSVLYGITHTNMSNKVYSHDSEIRQMSTSSRNTCWVLTNAQSSILYLNALPFNAI